MNTWQLRERAQATLAKETGYIIKPHADRLRVALAFPNTYWVGMSNLGFQTVYRLLNAQDDVVCERFFLPPKQELAEMVGAKVPPVTIESQTPINDFDVIAFSVSFEWDYVNVLTLLRMAGIPRYASERSTRHPLVVIGGAVTFVNPEPLAPFADVIAAGEGEELVPALAAAFRAATSRDDLLQQLATQRGFYVPSFYEPQYDGSGSLSGYALSAGRTGSLPVRKAAVKTTDALDPPATSIFTPDTEFGSRFLVEVVRGCANLCRFCWAGYNYLPVRAFPTDRILELAEAARPHASRVGLVSIALCDHPDIERILSRLHETGYSISPASLRLDAASLAGRTIGGRLSPGRHPGVAQSGRKLQTVRAAPAPEARGPRGQGPADARHHRSATRTTGERHDLGRRAHGPGQGASGAAILGRHRQPREGDGGGLRA